MIPLWLLLALPTPFTPVLPPPAATSQGAPRPEQAQPGGLVRVDPDSAPPVPRRLYAPGEFDRSAWRAELSQRDLDARESAFERLVAQVTGDPEARAVLDEWALDESAPELAWTSRLALREVARANRVRRAQRGPSIKLFRPSNDEFHAAPTELFVELEHKVDELMSEAPRAVAQNALPGGFDLQAGPNGVRLEVREVEDGVETRKTYEAENLAALLADHPELKGRISIVGVFPQATKRDIHEIIKQIRSRIEAPEVGADEVRPLPTDILGVYAIENVNATSTDRSALLVERIVPETIADVLDIRRGDLLLELNGRTLVALDDLTNGLAARKPGEEVRLTIERRGRESTLVWKPSPDEK